MKILFTAIVFAASINNAKAQGPIINIPDANFKTYLLANFDVNSDANIDSTEAANVTGAINIYGMNIADLTGIEAFTALTQLVCFNNQLTSLDVSANTALTTLYCGNNLLTGLNLSTNTALTTLDCFNNALTALDLSANIALTFLFCINNQLTSLNVQNGYNTNVTYFDATANSSLTCIQVDNASYSNTSSGWYKDATAGYSTNCTVGIEGFESDNEISIYPNPAQSHIIISSNAKLKNAQLEIYNVLGEKAYSEILKDEDVHLNVSSGIYFIKVFDGTNQYCKKLIVEQD